MQRQQKPKSPQKKSRKWLPISLASLATLLVAGALAFAFWTHSQTADSPPPTSEQSRTAESESPSEGSAASGETPAASTPPASETPVAEPIRAPGMNFEQI